ncbi:MAG TPA: glycosyltransferase family 4 protein [Solirubrobacteraceae bacterium]|nr:glycosyltransferase family 4 protein [Solirubrobacteraceae bacterium]
MHVLLLHNRYRNEGGEERAVADLAALLERRGHTVAVLERSSADTSKLGAARALVSGGAGPEQVGDAVRSLNADVVHAHNVHPLFGWRALAAAREAGARTVLHLHNFRLFCAIAVGYRNGASCFRCRGANTLPGVAYRCRGSTAEAVAYAVGLHRQQRPLLEHADRIVAVSHASARRLSELGLPRGRMTVLPNFVASDRFATRTTAGEGAYAFVSGRLVEEKGVDTAIAAARAAGVPLVIAGEGPDEKRLRSLADGGDVRFVGQLSRAALTDARAGAAVVLVPSRCEEACPYSALDALAGAIPVLVSDRGGLPELVGAGGLVLAADDVGAWEHALSDLWHRPQARRERGEAALEQARRRFGEDRYHEELIEIYKAPEAGESPAVVGASNRIDQ